MASRSLRHPLRIPKCARVGYGLSDKPWGADCEHPKNAHAGYGLSDKPRGAGDQGLYTIHTYADVAEELLRALGAGAVHVLAHDVGDTVAQELLARANARQAGAGLTGKSPAPLLCVNLF